MDGIFVFAEKVTVEQSIYSTPFYNLSWFSQTKHMAKMSRAMGFETNFASYYLYDSGEVTICLDVLMYCAAFSGSVIFSLLLAHTITIVIVYL